MPALNFPASSSSPWTAPNGVIYTWNADGYWEAKADPNDFDTDYLKLNATNDPVTGNLALNQDLDVGDNLAVTGTSAFTGLTTHAGGVKVTGGDVANGPGLYTTSNGNINVSNNAGERVASFASTGRIGFPASTGAAGVYISNTPSTSANLSYGIWLDPDWSDASGTTAYGINASAYDGPGTLNTFAGYRASGTTDTTKFASSDSIQAGFLAKNTISGAAEINAGFYSELTSISDKNYNFYAAGSASNYFAGATRIASQIQITGTADQAPVSPGTGTSDREGLFYYLTGPLSVSRDNNPVFQLARYQSAGAMAYFWQGFGAKQPDGTFPAAELAGTISSTGSTGNVGILITSESSTGPVVAQNSDARVKTLTPFTGNAADVVSQLNPGVNGFIAHELQQYVADAVTGTQDATEAIGTLADYDGTVLESDVTEPEELEYTEEVTDEYGVSTATVRTRTWTPTGTQPVYQGVDQTKLIPLLTKALQEALERIEALEAAAGDGVKGTTRKRKS